MSHTYALVEVSGPTYAEIKQVLVDAGIYDHAFSDLGQPRIDMHGLAIALIEREPKTLHSSVVHILQFFKYEHLPPHLQDISRPFCEMAREMAQVLPGNPETTVALRKLLEAKDAAVRSFLIKPDAAGG